MAFRSQADVETAQKSRQVEIEMDEASDWTEDEESEEEDLRGIDSKRLCGRFPMIYAADFTFVLGNAFTLAVLRKLTAFLPLCHARSCGVSCTDGLFGRDVRGWGRGRGSGLDED